MKNAILMIAGAALVALSTMQFAAATEHHHRTHHRTTEFRDCCIAKTGLLWRPVFSILPAERWLYRNDRVVVATLLEDLTLILGPERLRRFLATPLHEIILLKEVVHRPT
jgi:hypothetical protein